MLSKIAKFFLLVLFFCPVNTFALNASACYRVEVFFFKVGESCISFKEEGDLIFVKSFMRTVNIGSLAKRVNDEGEAIIERTTLKPRFFKFYQEEGRFKRYQEYKYLDDKIHVRETKYVDLTDKIERDEKKVYEQKGYSDPYATALFLFEHIGEEQSGVLRLFYDDRYYNVPYSIVKEEDITVDETDFNTYKVLVKTNVRGKGLLKPKGNWYLWIDKKTRMPVKMNVGFLIGSVNVIMEELKTKGF